MKLLSFLKHLLLAVAGITALLIPLLVRPAHGETLAGPVEATVLRVIDGDTAEVEARVWINQTLKVDVRLLGVDAPEIGAHAHCASERDRAEAAKAYLASLIEGRDVRLADIKFDKYGGRVDARILLADGRDAGALLLSKGLAMTYDGRRKTPWCSLSESQ